MRIYKQVNKSGNSLCAWYEWIGAS